MLTEKKRRLLLSFQRSEITEHHVYKRLAKRVKSKHNKDILKRIADDELRHYNFWKRITKQDVEPNWFKVWWSILFTRILGLTFGVRFMEYGEKAAQKNYRKVSRQFPSAKRIIKDEHMHELKLIKILHDERLKYVGSIVLGLNDALVELTGALAGFTLALQNTKLIAVVGAITGIAASLSMAASEYLSTKAEENDKHPIKASVYTGIAYFITVMILIIPFLLASNAFVALGFTVASALAIIFFFTFYTSVAMGLPFRKRFLEMALLSLGIAAFSFGVGWAIRAWLGVDI
jgi:VIT1/CCC1 family predicted Fe2+/Mn2+ transporter